MMIERQVGRTLAEAPKKCRETTLGAAEVLALALTVGLCRVLCGLNSLYDSDHIAALIRAR